MIGKLRTPSSALVVACRALFVGPGGGRKAAPPPASDRHFQLVNIPFGRNVRVSRTLQHMRRNFVAYLALFVALPSGSYAASTSCCQGTAWAPSK
jgi:hypothetical protein